MLEEKLPQASQKTFLFVEQCLKVILNNTDIDFYIGMSLNNIQQKNPLIVNFISRTAFKSIGYKVDLTGILTYKILEAQAFKEGLILPKVSEKIYRKTLENIRDNKDVYWPMVFEHLEEHNHFLSYFLDDYSRDAIPSQKDLIKSTGGIIHELLYRQYEHNLRQNLVSVLSRISQGKC